MTALIQFSRDALDDLERLERHLEQQGDPLAWALFDFVLDGLQVLTHQPGIGRPLPGGLRELILNRGKTGYLIKYRYLPEPGAVRVLRLRHQRQSGYTSQEI